MSVDQLWGGSNSVSSTSYSDSERDVVHAAFYLTNATHDSGIRKVRDQPHIYFPVGVIGINRSTLTKWDLFLLCYFSCNLFFLNILETITLYNRNIFNIIMSNCFNTISFLFIRSAIFWSNEDIKVHMGSVKESAIVSLPDLGGVTE